MKNWAKFSLAGFGLIGAGVGLALWSGAANWNAETTRAIEKLKQKALSIETKTVSFADFDNLPAPVAGYFRCALQDGQPVVRAAKIRHAGEFNLNGEWIPFDSEQHFSARPAAFVWDAKMKMNPLMKVRVRDSFVGGKGAMLVKMFGLLPLVDARDDAKLDAGALMRFLGEAVWLPTALLPDENLKWTAIDENRARATLTEAETTVSLEFTFNERGEIAEIFAPARFREVKGKYEPTAWIVRISRYEERGGMRIPTEGEVAWQLPAGDAPYWRGRVVDADYDFVR